MVNVLHKAVQIGDNHRWIPLQIYALARIRLFSPVTTKCLEQTGMIELVKPRAGEVTSVNQRILNIIDSQSASGLASCHQKAPHHDREVG